MDDTARLAHIQKLERRIRKQRVALREHWEIVEMRAGYKRIPSDVRSRMLAAWCRTNIERNRLAAEVARLQALVRSMGGDPR